MHKKSHFAHANNYLCNLSLLIGEWLDEQGCSVMGYSHQSVKQRIIQRILALSYNSFLRGAVATFEHSGQLVSPGIDELECDGIRLHLKSGRVSFTFKPMYSEIKLFGIHWLYVLYRIVMSMLSSTSKAIGRSTLVYGVGEEAITGKEGDSAFIRFCRSGDVTPLAKADLLLVRSIKKKAASSDSRCRYDREPLLGLLNISGISFFGRMTLLLQHLTLPLFLILLIFRSPLFILLSRDIAYHFVAARLNKLKVIQDIVLTNSNYTQQFLWMHSLPEREFGLHMIWYSVNNSPFVFRVDPVHSIQPLFLYLSVDRFWVWTEAQGVQLQSLCPHTSFTVVGPVLWRLDRGMKEGSGLEAVVSIFDVTPVDDEWMKAYGVMYNYYSAETMIAFVRHVLDTIKALSLKHGRTWRVVLKPKRPYHPIHNKDYIAELKKLEAMEPNFEILNSATDMFDLIKQSEFSIVIPYSSPAYVASALGRPAIYYDPNSDLESTFEPATHVCFASNPTELHQVIESVVQQLCAARGGEVVSLPDGQGGA